MEPSTGPHRFLHFETTSKDLLVVASWAGKSISERPPLSIYSGLVLVVQNGSLQISGSDGDIHCSSSISVKQIEPGQAIIGAKAFVAWLRALNTTDKITIKEDEETRELVCYVNKINMYRFRKIAGTYPVVTRGEGTGVSGNLKGFGEALAKVTHAAGTGEGPLAGIHVRSSGDHVTITATDSYRLARIECDGLTLGEFAGILPRKAVSIIASLQGEGQIWADDEGRMLEISSENEAGYKSVILKTLEGHFPTADAILDLSSKKSGTVDRKKFLRLLDRVAPFSAERQVVEIYTDAQELSVRGWSLDIGEVIEKIPFQYETGDLHVGLNPGYLKDAIAGFTTDVITFHWSDDLSPILIAGDSTEIELIMPVRL